MELKQATSDKTSDKSKRLIDAMKLVTRLSKRISILILLGAKASGVYDEVLKVIAEAPTEDAAPVMHGQMEEIEPCQITVDRQCCSCGTAMGSKDNYCPNCGAKMEKCEIAPPKSKEECDLL